MSPNPILVLHSVVRWLVVVFALWALARAYAGWAGRRPWTAVDRRSGLLFSIFLDLQVLIGLLVYFFVDADTSPFQAGLLADPAGRYFTWFHALPMLIALALAHIGSSRARKAVDDVTKHRTAAVFYTLSILVILLAIPWPFTPFGAPWLRL